MKPSFALLLLSLAPLAVARAEECAPISGDRITAGDFAALLPAFGALPPDTPIAPSPLAGVTRHFRAFEVAGLAKRYGVTADALPGLCFARRAGRLDGAQLLEAMRTALADVPGARIEIVELSQAAAPSGTIEFRREQLAAPADPHAHVPVLWRGNILYGENRRFSIWARVLVSARIPRIVAAEKLLRGVPITANRLRIDNSERFPGPGDTPTGIDQVAGRVPLRDIDAGGEIHLSQIAAAPEVARGDLLEVEVRSGAARLLLPGRAESAGRAGDLIPVRNLSSNRVFQARIAGKGRAFLDAGLSTLPATRAQTN